MMTEDRQILTPCSKECYSRTGHSSTVDPDTTYLMCDACGGLVIPRTALAVRQPWAWAIAQNVKDVENRSTFAVNRGDMQPRRIAIYSSGSMTQREYSWAKGFMEDLDVIPPPPDELTFGCIVAVTTVVDVVNDSDSPWFMGPRGLILQNSYPVEPIRATGNLGYYQWERSNKDLIKPKPWHIKLGNQIREDAREGAPMELGL